MTERHCRKRRERKSPIWVTQLPPGVGGCATGGALIQTLCPPTSATVCNGSVVTVTQLPVGSILCPAGGALIESTGPPATSAAVCNGTGGGGGGSGALNQVTFSTVGVQLITVPPEVTMFIVELWGGGGGGSGNLTGIAPGAGGGGGGYVKVSVPSGPGINSFALTIGAGGVGGLADTNGGDGGDTTFVGNGQDFTAEGGQGGQIVAVGTFPVGGLGGMGVVTSGGGVGPLLSQGQTGQASLNENGSDGGGATSGGLGGRFTLLSEDPLLIAPEQGKFPGGAGAGGYRTPDTNPQVTTGANGANGAITITYPSTNPIGP